MKVLWVHTFDPALKNAGNFMFNFYESLRVHYPEISIDLFAIEKGNFFQFARSLFALRRRASLYDVVHFQYGSICSFSGLFLKHPRKVLTLRGSDWHRLEFGGGRLQRLHSRLSVLLSRLSIFHMQLVIAVSERIAREVSAVYGNEVPVVIDPVNPIFFDDCGVKARASGRAFRVVLNSIDLANPIKNLDFAERVVAYCSRMYQVDIEVVRIHNLSQEGVRGLLLTSDCLLLTSEYEGWPNCVKEALICGLAVVASDVSDLQIWSQYVDSLTCVREMDEAAFAGCLYRALLSSANGYKVDSIYTNRFSGKYASDRLVQSYNSFL